MGANVFLVNCDPDGFEQTVGSTVELSEYPDRPSGLGDDGEVRFWGVPEGTRNRNYFEDMESGDLLLFYVDGEYAGTGRVGTTVEDEEEWASSTFWSESAPLLYTVEAFEPVEVPAAAAHGIFDYSAGYTPDALSRVADGRVDNSLDAIEAAMQRFSERGS